MRLAPKQFASLSNRPLGRAVRNDLGRIVEMNIWDDFLDLVEEAHLTFGGKSDSEIVLAALKGFLDVSYGTRDGSPSSSTLGRSTPVPTQAQKLNHQICASPNLDRHWLHSRPAKLKPIQIRSMCSGLCLRQR
jgi:hypothetical protein